MYTASKEDTQHGIRSLWKQWSDAAKGVTDYGITLETPQILKI